jgi:hypothetical protein
VTACAGRRNVWSFTGYAEAGAGTGERSYEEQHGNRHEAGLDDFAQDEAVEQQVAQRRGEFDAEGWRYGSGLVFLVVNVPS